MAAVEDLLRRTNSDKIASRVLKRKYSFFLPKESIEIPSYREVASSAEPSSPIRSSTSASNPSMAEKTNAKSKTPPVGKIDTSAKGVRRLVVVTEKAPQGVHPSSKSNGQGKKQAKEEGSEQEDDDDDDDEDEEEDESRSGMELYSDSSEERDSNEDENNDEQKRDGDKEDKSRKRPREGDHGEDKAPAKRLRREDAEDDNNGDSEDNGDEQRKKSRVVHESRHGRTALTRFSTMSDNWEKYAKFPQNTVPNLTRAARIVDRASLQAQIANGEQPPEAEMHDIRFTKEAKDVFEHFIHTRCSQIVQQASAFHQHRGKNRFTPSDVHLAIQSNPTFIPFDMELYLNAHRTEAPAIVNLVQQLSTGKSNRKQSRLVFEHTERERKTD
jgi:hypothetical protein